MTLYLENPSDTFTAWRGESINGKRYGRGIEKTWSAKKLAAIGLYAPAEADPIPEGKVTTGMTVERVGGVVKYVRTLEDKPVPTSVTMRQARLAMNQAGILSQVEAALDALSEPSKTVAKIEWETATIMKRNHPLVDGLAAGLGLTEAQIDALFVTASGMK
jgi:hypothetical protein